MSMTVSAAGSVDFLGTQPTTTTVAPHAASSARASESSSASTTASADNDLLSLFDGNGDALGPQKNWNKRFVVFAGDSLVRYLHQAFVETSVGNYTACDGMLTQGLGAKEHMCE